jgi:hypothetical protein
LQAIHTNGYYTTIPAIARRMMINAPGIPPKRQTRKTAGVMLISPTPKELSRSKVFTSQMMRIPRTAFTTRAQSRPKRWRTAMIATIPRPMRRRISIRIHHPMICRSRNRMQGRM